MRAAMNAITAPAQTGLSYMTGIDLVAIREPRS
jgi:hypothetical protein